MKRRIIILLMSGLIIPYISKSQNIEDAKKLIYYERYNSARNMLDSILITDPNNSAAWYWLSQAYIRSDETSGLRNRFSKAPETMLKNPYYLVAYGHLLLTEDKADSANIIFTEAIEGTRSKNPEILAAVANAHILTRAGNGNTALQLLHKAIKKDKKNPALYILMGDAYRKLGNGGEAYKAYQTALQKDKNYAAALYQTGKIFVSQNNAEIYLKQFKRAVEVDPNYAPALYELYYHYYFIDPSQAMKYFALYQAKSDFSKKNDYLYTDLLYLNKHYEQAIKKAKYLILEHIDTMPRLYKLIAYSYLGLKDTVNAISYMNSYFLKETDSNMIVKDYETMAELYAAIPGKTDSAITYYETALNIATDSSAVNNYYKKISDLYKKRKDYAMQAHWLGKYYLNNSKANNLDLFNWGIAHFKAKEYQQADSVFGMYTTKYPEQGFGFYWRARTNALRDSAMEKGMAVPYYEQLIEVIEKDTTNETNKKWLVQAYGYLASWETNEQKDYETAISHLNKILEYDPDNEDAKRYIDILEEKVPDSNRASAND